MFNLIPNQINYDEIEADLIRDWKANDIFKKSIKSGRTFVFYEGPPTANGKPGIHHVMARTIKDIITRYKSLQGFKVERKAGWDTHGLPVEIEVEKQLKIEGRDQILQYGLGEFNEACRRSVFTYKDLWDEMTERMGYWVDLSDPYITCENDYIESVWWILSELFKKDLIYKGYKIQPYCPKCGTALSSHEVSQGYKDVKDLTATVRFQLKDEENTYLLAWTTTPWTLPSNVALAVGKDIDYIKVRHVDEKNGPEFLILAKALADSLLSDEYEIESTFKGSELVGRRYHPLFDFVETNENSHQVLSGDFVTTEDGTGIVHMAPAYGDDDYKTCLANDIPVDIIVNTDGTFSDKAGEFAGYYIKDADPEIVTNLKHRGLLFKSQKLEHSYPHCWRHGTPLFYYATSSWFIRTTQFKEQMIRNNQQINWYPPEVGEGRFGNWLENNVDWALSRNRYWGTPLNIWQTEDEQHLKSIGSIAELRAEIKKAVDKGYMTMELHEIDLHKPQMDNITLVCDETGEPMHRTPEVIDCWFDSGSMPFAQWHYPFESQDGIKNGDLFPADFICEGIDQTRGWFYTLLAISTMLYDKAPYKNVIVNNLILDKDGQKMSKSRGNTVEPMSVMKKYGADTLRWFFVTSSQPWVAKRFDEEAISEVQRKFVGTLINTYSFFALYANVDGFTGKEKIVPYDKRPEIDRWIISLLYTTIEKVNQSFDSYDITTATRAINDFLIDDVSNWYVRRNRRRFWKSELNGDKLAAYQTLYEIMLSIVKMASPVMPFLSDYLYKNLTDTFESVHHDSFPVVTNEQKTHIDSQLEAKMAMIQKIVELARALRSENQLKIRQPLAKMLVYVEGEKQQKAVAEFSDVIKDELNVKGLEIAHDVSEIASRKARPNFKHFGPKYGAKGRFIADAIKQFSEAQIETIEKGQSIKLTIEDEDIEIDQNFFDVIHEKKEGTVVQSAEGISVALDIVLTDSLIQEGIAREFVNRLQNLRKDNDYELTDRIRVEVNSGAKIKDAINAQLNYIKNETLSEVITFSDSCQSNPVKVEGEDVFIHIEKS